MRYSTVPRDRIYVKGYGFLSFAKNMGKNLSIKYGQKLFDSAKKSATDTIKTASKRAIQKTAKATGGLIGNKTDKITNASKKSDGNIEMETNRASLKDEGKASPKDVPKKDTYLQKTDNKLLMN